MKSPTSETKKNTKAIILNAKGTGFITGQEVIIYNPVFNNGEQIGFQVFGKSIFTNEMYGEHLMFQDLALLDN